MTDLGPRTSRVWQWLGYFGWLSLVASLCPLPVAAAVAYHDIDATDHSIDDFFRVRFRVQTDVAPTSEMALQLAEELIDSRLLRRVLHVVEVLIYAPGELDHERPDAYVLWAYRGDPTIRPPIIARTFDDLTAVVEVGPAAIRMAKLSTLGAAVDERPQPGATAASTTMAHGMSSAANSGAPVLDQPRSAQPASAPAGASDGLPKEIQRSMVEAELLSLLSRWRSAWQERALDRYMSFYSPDFDSDDLDFDGWREKKRGVFAKAKRVEVDMSQIEVVLASDGSSVEARFLQDYRSDGLSDVGYKTLHLVREGEDLKIVAEEWERLH